MFYHEASRTTAQSKDRTYGQLCDRLNDEILEIAREISIALHAGRQTVELPIHLAAGVVAEFSRHGESIHARAWRSMPLPQ